MIEHMFDSSPRVSSPTPPVAPPRAPSAAEVLAWAEALGRTATAADDGERVERLAAMETLKAAAAAAQAKISVDLAESQEAAQASVGLPARQRGVGVAAQVALARRESPHRGGRLLGLARALVREMPHTLAALETGRLERMAGHLAGQGDRVPVARRPDSGGRRGLVRSRASGHHG